MVLTLEAEFFCVWFWLVHAVRRTVDGDIIDRLQIPQMVIAGVDVRQRVTDCADKPDRIVDNEEEFHDRCRAYGDAP